MYPAFRATSGLDWRSYPQQRVGANDCRLYTRTVSGFARSRRYGEVGRRVMPIERVRDIVVDKHPAHYVPPIMRAFAA